MALQRSWLKIQVNLRPSSYVTMKGGTFIVTNMSRMTLEPFCTSVRCYGQCLLGVHYVSVHQKGKAHFRFILWKNKEWRGSGFSFQKGTEVKAWCGCPTSNLCQSWFCMETTRPCLMRWHSSRRATYLITKVLYRMFHDFRAQLQEVFLGLCDQKSSYKHVSDFGRLRSYDRLKLGIEGNDYWQ